MPKYLLLPLFLSATLFLQASEVSTNAADTLAEEKCASCHVIFTMSKSKFKNMKAPPFWAIAKKVKVAYPNRLEGIKFVKEYVIHPSKESMIFPEATFKHFGLMASQQGKLSDKELQTIAEYMLDK